MEILGKKCTHKKSYSPKLFCYLMFRIFLNSFKISVKFCVVFPPVFRIQTILLMIRRRHFFGSKSEFKRTVAIHIQQMRFYADRFGKNIDNSCLVWLTVPGTSIYFLYFSGPDLWFYVGAAVCSAGSGPGRAGCFQGKHNSTYSRWAGGYALYRS